MKILLVSVVSQTSKTGVTSHYNRLMTQFADRGESVQLITPANTPALLKKVLGLFRRIAALLGPNGVALYLELENFISIWAAVRREDWQQVDVIHAQDVTSGTAAALALSRKVRVVVTCHFNDDPVKEYQERYKLNAWTIRRLTRWFQYLFQQPDAFITVSDYTRQTASAIYPKLAHSTVIHNGVVFPEKSPRSTEGVFIVVNIGTLEERKNQRLLIETADALRNRGFTHFQFWLLGDGPKRSEWTELVHKKNLEGYVSFMGYRPNVSEFLERASLYVHTALNESWGYSITEAIAAKIPVLALSTGGIPEQFDRNKAGLLPLKATAADVANAILRYQLVEARQRLANQQYKYASKRFQIDHIIDRHLALFREIVAPQQETYQVAAGPEILAVSPVKSL
ncbi:hypothetical protein GCM10027592_32240 [Spirosoma flavus]